MTPQSRLACWIERSLATDAADGWPARLSVRWLDETFPEMSRGVSQRPPLPKASGAASFARASRRFAISALSRVTISFGVRRGFSLGEATDEIEAAAREILPGNITGAFQGNAKLFQDSLKNMGLLLLIAMRRRIEARD